VSPAPAPSERLNRPVTLDIRGGLAYLLPQISWQLTLFIPGRPAPQGSKKYFGPKQVVEMSQHVGAWRDDVRAACLREWGTRGALDAPLFLEVEFVHARTAGAPKGWTPSKTSAPDLSKLVRSTEDAITSAGVWRDDARVVATLSWKRMAEIDETPGAHIRIGVAP
jgi:crossover junction endodeoxyribonuclease RusA